MDSASRPATLLAVVSEPESEPDRLLPTHLEALDDLLIAAAGAVGDVLGGSRQATTAERAILTELYRSVDRAAHEYAAAIDATGLPSELRAGQILGTASLMGYLARAKLDLTAPEPLAGDLDEPGVGVVAGFGELIEVRPGDAAYGSRWVIRTEDGRRFPASLSILLHDSSGVQKDAALDEHRTALKAAVAAAEETGADPFVVGAGIDWLLHDWLMAHRDGPSSGAVEITSGKLDDALMIVAASAASARMRSAYDPGLLRLPSLN
ncbi:hypothetical protein [Marmoricola sp. URHA0025 HA25]